MDRQALSNKIGELVDVMRTDQDRRITMVDIASITEVLITTMERYFGAIDTSIYREFHALSDRIATLRDEVARAQPKEIQANRIPRAGKELDAVVKATEEATNTIMEAAEEIMGADATDIGKYQATVNDACMRIFEACSFQDITGQRVTKVIDTLTFIEERIGTMLSAWGDEVADAVSGSDEDRDENPDKALLHGPALEGEGVSQDDVDALLSGHAIAAADAPGPVPEPVSEPEPAPRAEAAAAPPLPEAPDAAPLAAAGEPGDDTRSAGKEVSQDEIDALFD